MKYPQLNHDLFKANRQKLIEHLPKNALAVVHANRLVLRNGDQYFPFRQSSNFFYLSGIDYENCILLLNPSHPQLDFREVLFIERQSEKEIIYDGKKLSFHKARIISGIKKIMYSDQFWTVFKEAIYFSEKVYLPHNEYPSVRNDLNPDVQFARLLRDEYPALELARLEPILTKLRLIKEPEELELLQHACDITEKAFFRVLSFLKPSIYEYQVEAEITHEFLINRANGHAYKPIIASGKNACTLHYIENKEECMDGDLLLMDFGAEYANYAADCTRTIPVSGRFSPRQRGVYEAVLRLFKEGVKLMVPGTCIAEIDKKLLGLAEKEMIELGLFTDEEVKQQKESRLLVKKYLPHGIAHFVGLDVHDVGNKFIPLEEGMVLTCEPGIYIEEENIGIRIENNIVVADEPVDLMENIPLEIDEIEELMSKNRYKED